MNVTVYSATWCGPCKMLKPALKKAGIEFTDVDVDANAEDADKAKIRGLPTVVISNDEGKEVRRTVGMLSPKQIADIKRGLNGSD